MHSNHLLIAVSHMYLYCGVAMTYWCTFIPNLGQEWVENWWKCHFLVCKG